MTIDVPLNLKTSFKPLAINMTVTLPAIRPLKHATVRTQDDPEVRSQVCQIHERLDVMEAAMLSFKRQFAAYEYLWTTDIQAMFREFLKCVTHSRATTSTWSYCFRSRPTVVGTVGTAGHLLEQI